MNAPHRHPLPDRRPTETHSIFLRNMEWTLSFGFDQANQVREVFADGAKGGSEREELLDDACVLISLLLQSGWEASVLARKLGGQVVSGEGISIIGLICHMAADVSAPSASGNLK